MDKKQNPDWQFIEEIAALLEKSISPLATVQHNVRLPVIGKPNRSPRQCDIVITYGEPPRQTLAIVEVQKRTRKPSIDIFHGWIKKMREVGAQNLMCVSTKGFPKSIIEDVKNEYGPTVKLLTLNELQNPQFSGLSFITPQLVHISPHIEFTSIGDVEVQGNKSEKKNLPKYFNEMSIKPTDKIFELDHQPTFLALTDLINSIFNEITREFVPQNKIRNTPYEFEVDLGVKKDGLRIIVGENRYEIKHMQVNGTIEYQFFEIPLITYEYKQEFHDNILAWVTTAKGIYQLKEIEMKMVFKPNSEGYLEITAIELKGAEHLSLYLSEDKVLLNWYISNRGLS